MTHSQRRDKLKKQIGASGLDAMLVSDLEAAGRVRRWRDDPWVRLTIPHTKQSVEGTVQIIDADTDLSPEVIELVVDRWGMWGATTAETFARSRSGAASPCRSRTSRPMPLRCWRSNNAARR